LAQIRVLTLLSSRNLSANASANASGDALAGRPANASSKASEASANASEASSNASEATPAEEPGEDSRTEREGEQEEVAQAMRDDSKELHSPGPPAESPEDPEDEPRQAGDDHHVAAPLPGAEGVDWVAPEEPEPDVSKAMAVVEKEEQTKFEWEIVFDKGPVKVRSKKDLSSRVVGTMVKGDVVIGKQEGWWVSLIHGHGFIKRILARPRITLLRRRSISYVQLGSGCCRDVGRFPILDASSCEAAGLTLGYSGHGLEVYRGDRRRPEGCYGLRGRLWLATSTANRGQCASKGRTPICSSEAPKDSVSS